MQHDVQISTKTGLIPSLIPYNTDATPLRLGVPFLVAALVSVLRVYALRLFDLQLGNVAVFDRSD